MIRNPIRKVLSSMQAHDAQVLLMGGQACVFYGAAEFSRDVDFAVLASKENLEKFHLILDDLSAEVIAIPPFRLEFLERGHAVHFRCNHPDAKEIRIDIMSRLRGVDDFEELWKRKTTVTFFNNMTVELMSLPDLVKAKKTQREKDWIMLARIVEADYFDPSRPVTQERIRFWLLEMRTPSLLIHLAEKYSVIAMQLADYRKALIHALSKDEETLRGDLDEEKQIEQREDRKYWLPLRRELEMLRSEARTQTNK